MTYRTTITIDDHTYPIYRDVTHQHPRAVHDALGTRSESDLQHFLDGVNAADWYDDDGNHMGPDTYGIEMFIDEHVVQ